MNANSRLVGRWQTLAARERLGLTLAAGMVALAVLWWVGLAPALATLRLAEGQRQTLDAQLEHMKQLQAQAKSMQAQARMAPDEARRLLEASLKPFAASAQLSLVGERALITLKGASSEALTQWLLQVRLNLRSTPNQAQLVRASNGTLDGTLVLNLK